MSSVVFTPPWPELESVCEGWQVLPFKVTANLFLLSLSQSDEWRSLPPPLFINIAEHLVIIFAWVLFCQVDAFNSRSRKNKASRQTQQWNLGQPSEKQFNALFKVWLAGSQHKSSGLLQKCLFPGCGGGDSVWDRELYPQLQRECEFNQQALGLLIPVCFFSQRNSCSHFTPENANWCETACAPHISSPISAGLLSLPPRQREEIWAMNFWVLLIYPGRSRYTGVPKPPPTNPQPPGVQPILSPLCSSDKSCVCLQHRSAGDNIRGSQWPAAVPRGGSIHHLACHGGNPCLQVPVWDCDVCKTTPPASF